MKKLSTRAAALALAVLLAVSPAVSASEALGTEIHYGTTQLAQGVTLTRQHLWSATYSDLRTERYLEYTPGELVQPIVAYGDSIPSKNTLTALAQGLEAEGKRVIGGVNGDYFVVATGTPLGMVMTDGVLRSSSSYHYALGFDADNNAFIGLPDLSITATFRDHTYSVSGGLNKTRTSSGGFVLYTDDYGTTTRHTEPGIDVILTPLTKELGKQVKVTLEIDTAAPAPGSATPGESTGGADSEDDPITDSSDLALSDLPQEETEADTPVQTIQDTLVYTDVPTVGGRIACKVDRVLQSTGSIDIPEGKLVLSIHASGSEWLVSELSALQAGDALQIDITSPDERWESAVTAVGGLYKMVTNGQAESGLETAQAPRTAVGIRPDGSTIFYTVDGRQSGYSVGASMSQVARRLIELGCTEAVCMDGGGSTTLGATLPASDAFGVLNSPSDGSPRAVSNALFLVTRQTVPGPVNALTVTPGDVMLLSGQSVELSAAGIDATGQVVKKYNTSSVTFSAPGEAGTLDGNTFTAGTVPGTYLIQARAGGKTAQAQVTVVTTPDRLALTNADSGEAVTALALAPGGTIRLDAAAFYRNLPLLCHDELFNWSVSEGIGTIDQSGRFTASPTVGTGSIFITVGEITLTIPVTLSAHITTVESFEGDFSAMANSLTAQIEPERRSAYVRYGSQSARITYDTTGSEYAAVGVPLELAPEETYLSLWVYGDGSGNTLTAPMRTAQGDVNEQILAVLNFTGWQQIITPLPENITGISVLKIKPTGTAPSGMLWLDQITTSNQYAADLTAPTVSLYLDEMGLQATIQDNVDRSFAPGQVIAEYDGQLLQGALDGLILKASLPELDGKAHRVTVTVTDASGNIGRSSYDIMADYGTVSPFADAGGHWAESYVNYLYDQGISNGTASGTQLLFQPDKNITRGEFAVMAARWMRLDLTQYSSVELPFVDMGSIPTWALDGVKAMYALGVMQGSTGAEGTYAYAQNSITRAEAMTMLGRIQAKGYTTSTLTFADAGSIPAWASEYVATMTAQGIINGYTDNTIAPNNPIKRGEMAKVLYAMR